MNAEAGSAGWGAGSQVEHRPGHAGIRAGSPTPSAVPEAPLRSRREMRAERRQRQTLLLWCALVLAAALVAAVVILGIARDRTLVQHNPAALPASRPGVSGLVAPARPIDTRGAPGGGAL